MREKSLFYTWLSFSLVSGFILNLPVKEFCYLRTNLLTAAVRRIAVEEKIGPKR